MGWRAKLEKEPTLLQPYQIDEIVREVRRRLVNGSRIRQIKRLTDARHLCSLVFRPPSRRLPPEPYDGISKTVGRHVVGDELRKFVIRFARQAFRFLSTGLQKGLQYERQQARTGQG